MADVMVQANTRNAIILENHIYGRGVSEESGEENGPQWWQDSSYTGLRREVALR
jgi:hypothetical protein